MSYFRRLPKNLLVKVLSCSQSIFETNQLLASTPTANRSSPFVNPKQTIEQTESLQRNSCWEIFFMYVASLTTYLFNDDQLIIHTLVLTIGCCVCKGDGLSVMATLSSLSAFKMTSCDAKCNKCRPVPDKCLNKCFVCFSHLKNMTFRAIFAQNKMTGELKKFHAFTLNN